MKSAIWWKLRYYWHAPQSKRGMLKPPTFWNQPFNYLYFLNKRKYKFVIMLFIGHSTALLYRIFWGTMWIQPLRCNGDKGGWRTRFCEWLENKAREAEIREHNVAILRKDKHKDEIT